jgi:hypothetical protein
MSHPDPLFDPDNAYEDDDMFTEPNDSDVPFVEYLYDDHNDFYESEDDSFDDSMDGDAESAFGSCGWGVDEQYEHNCDYGSDW